MDESVQENDLVSPFVVHYNNNCSISDNPRDCSISCNTGIDNNYPASPLWAPDSEKPYLGTAIQAPDIAIAVEADATSSKKRRWGPYHLEKNPRMRKRVATTLLRKLQKTIDEYTIRTGGQAVVLDTGSGNVGSRYRVFGASPLQDVIRKLQPVIMERLQDELTNQTHFIVPNDAGLFHLPLLAVDGIQAPLDSLTQSHLRRFIPLMLKYSTGRARPGWGKESMRPPWWPVEIPFQNVRFDCRSEEEKSKLSWSAALKEIVRCCYRYHGREDLLTEEKTDYQKVAGQSTSGIEENALEGLEKEESTNEDGENQLNNIIHLSPEFAQFNNVFFLVQCDQ